jgi:hypothetical protein
MEITAELKICFERPKRAADEKQRRRRGRKKLRPKYFQKSHKCLAPEETKLPYALQA